MKSILSFAASVLFMAVGLTLTTASAQSADKVKVFMQPASYVGSSVQYGNNPSAGHYAQVDDAKIYYEVYGEGCPIIVLTVVVWVAHTKWDNLLTACRKPIRSLQSQPEVTADPKSAPSR